MSDGKKSGTSGKGGRRGGSASKRGAGKGSRAKSTRSSPAEKPTGEDRVLQFADEIQSVEIDDQEEQEQQLETWVTCRVGEEAFALPVAQVQEILRVSSLTKVPHAPFPVRGVTNMRGYVLPVVDLRIRLAMKPVEIGERHRVMVVASRGRLIGLLVDAVEQVLTVDRLALEPAPADVMTDRSYYIIGIYRRDDDILILLDADRVLQVREADDEALDAG